MPSTSEDRYQEPIPMPASRPGWPKIWGFDLGELNFSAFKSSNMFDRRWHLRRERFVAYQAAMLICLAAECTATYSLDKYEDLQTHVEDRFAPAHLYNNDIIDMEISTIVLCVAVACLFGADFFFLLQFPRRRYPLWYQRTKEFFAITITCGVFACALGSTIVIARNSAKIEHVSQAVADAAAAYYYRPPLQYRDWPVNIAYVCLLWPGWLACVVSTILMFKAADWDRLNGTEPRGLLHAAKEVARGAPLSARPSAAESSTEPLRPPYAIQSTSPSTSSATELSVPPEKPEH
ncbi:hypothetical protein BMF94_1452 [Rhodotorula taiwanensis]|uniref:Uncharacterized protein n=1 Tax=Rhodotorula taiwanensis TaxID=741276 RepID=A0A2S5BFK0_9BASI|nr:hypothetical protein BMF94_1452 [Rhodotorula taiwanensis]